MILLPISRSRGARIGDTAAALIPSPSALELPGMCADFAPSTDALFRGEPLLVSCTNPNGAPTSCRPLAIELFDDEVFRLDHRGHLGFNDASGIDCSRR